MVFPSAGVGPELRTEPLCARRTVFDCVYVYMLGRPSPKKRPQRSLGMGDGENQTFDARDALAPCRSFRTTNGVGSRVVNGAQRSVWHGV